MIVVSDPATIDRIAHPGIRRLVRLRTEQVREGEPFDPRRHGRIIVAQPGADAETLESALGWPLLTDPDEGVSFGHPDFAPSLEVMEEHPDCFELGVVLNDDDFFAALFVPKGPEGEGERAESVDPRRLAMCRAHAAPAREAPPE